MISSVITLRFPAAAQPTKD